VKTTQDDQQHHTERRPAGDSSFFSTGSNGSSADGANSSAARALSLVRGSRIGSHVGYPPTTARHAVEKQPRDQQCDPDDEPKQADGIHQRQPADPLGPQALKVGGQADP